MKTHTFSVYNVSYNVRYNDSVSEITIIIILFFRVTPQNATVGQNKLANNFNVGEDW